MQYKYSTSTSNPRHYPVKVFDAMLLFRDGIESIPIRKFPYGDWGDSSPVEVLSDECMPIPDKLCIIWMSVTEKKIYKAEETIDTDQLQRKIELTSKENGKQFRHFVIGMAPYGGVAFWLRGYYNAVLVSWTKANETTDYLFPKAVQMQCDSILATDPEVRDYLSSHGLPDPHLFDRMMQQFTYRFLPLLKKWDEDSQTWTDYDEDEKKPELDFVEVKCHDGTFDRLRDGSLLSYHQAGKPSRVCVGWHVGKREYSAYFFFSHDELAQVFRTCYGAHPDTKVDFLLQIDPDSNHYEPALFRYGMKAPLVIGPNACQVLAFRNKFECYRSPNYTQPRGAWR